MVVVVVVAVAVVAVGRGGYRRLRLAAALALALAARGVAVAVHGGELGFRLDGGGGARRSEPGNRQLGCGRVGSEPEVSTSGRGAVQPCECDS